MFWTLTLIGVVKYVGIALNADDHGEGNYRAHADFLLFEFVAVLEENLVLKVLIFWPLICWKKGQCYGTNFTS
jgi:K+ transporter